MARVEPSQLLQLQRDVDHIRNFCILAHVDHGKTTLSDSLVSSNGIISQRLAGKLRFLDSTEEEQKRGITMHSSAIALLYRMEEKGPENSGAEDFLINLVDSPGHIDFSSDVSTAARLCDGALIVVDAIEGVCTQTHAVIYKALRERMKPCLVLNKIDRLIVESRLSPTEAFHHLRRLVENVNALAFTLVKSELLKEAMEDPAFTDFELDASHPLVVDWEFAPEKGNVQFASALDSWGFGVMKFVNILSKRYQLNKNVLRQYIFEDYHINLDTKKICKADSSKPPLFAALVLEPLWRLYDLTVMNADTQALLQFVTNDLGISLPPREINARDPRSTLQAIARRWLPLADSLLRMVVRNMPSPKSAQKKRSETLVPMEVLSHVKALDGEETEESRCLRAVEDCDTSEDAPLVIFVSKMMPVKVSELSKQDVAMLNQQRLEKAKGTEDEGFDLSLKPDHEVFVAIGRIFSGVLHRKSRVFVLSAKYDVQSGKMTTTAVETKATVAQGEAGPVLQDHLGCYLMLGPSVYPADSVPAGNIVGIVGLEDYLLKTATLSDRAGCFALKAITFQAKPMLKVAVDVPTHKDLKRLEQGLQALYQFDPVVEVRLEDNGQWTMTCLGELHLDQCIKTLTDKFMKCEVKVSEPLVSFRETILLSSEAASSASDAPTPYPSSLPPSSASLPPSSSASVHQSAGTHVITLPPPWCDLPDLSKARHGRIRFLPDPNNPNLAITFRCFPLPNANAYLEQWAAQVKQLDEHIARRYLHSDASISMKTFLEQHKAVDQVWKGNLERVRHEREEILASQNAVEIQRINEIMERLGGLEGLEESLQENILSLGPHVCPANLLLFHPTTCFDIYRGPVPDDAHLPLPPPPLNSFSSLSISAPAATHGGGTPLSPSVGTVSSAAAGGTGGNPSAMTPSPNPIASSSLGRLSAFDRIGSLVRSQHCVLTSRLWERLHSAVVAGFQEAAFSGPLMNEPLYNVGFLVERVELSQSLTDQVFSPDQRREAYTNLFSPGSAGLPEDDTVSISSSGAVDKLGVLSTGQIISEVKDHLRACMLSCPLRIVEPIYQCDLQCDQSQLGNLYAVLSKRRGTVFKEDIIEGTSLFLLSAFLPVVQSFHFAQDLLKKTSGSGTAPQLSFSHWSTMAQDPFWRPRTEEELEEFGEQYLDEHNLARAWINKIRKRKGLAVDEQVVVFAEKQRTLNKKK